MVDRYHEESGHPIWIYKKLSSTSSGHLENIERSRTIAQSSNKLRQIQEISLLQSLYLLLLNIRLSSDQTYLSFVFYIIIV